MCSVEGAAALAAPPTVPIDAKGSYTLEQLKQRCHLNGVEPTMKEQYLNEGEFTAVFGMDKAALGKFAKWKHVQSKKRVGLF